ncbi:hypothetical protein CAN33_0041525 [Aspergillus niger]|uniref:C2H2 type master regulator of conidiophore development brlA n=1 Tax=Aspergillus niger TaxID=5061 RepID=A0A505HWD6_ASPNG|nr:hypothetical protein CAN33_0041525 [Aspergillus niger]
MASHTKKDDFCLECHWEAFHLDGKEAEDASEAQPVQWNCSDQVHHTPAPPCNGDDDCNVEEDCCDVDDCSITCPSVCDGFVDCGDAAVCSVSHCDEDHCENTDPVCFDEHCFGTGTNIDGEHSLESLLGLGTPLNLDTSDLLSPTTMPQSQVEQPKTMTQPTGMNPAPTQKPTNNWKPCRTHVHRCRTHGHHVHSYSPYSPYSRHSRSSVSSQLSPGETPPPLEGGTSSVLTSPEYVPDTEVFICRWISKADGTQLPCGATFADACGLQEHLVASHMATVDGAKGTGYYCCWEGCHRPDEPFSQKSKLQGHFLTHSNYKNFKCSVCGKMFARQATLERHERSHRGEKPYKCSECGKSFTDSSELKTHSRTHTGEKPFKCTYPGCNFQTGDSSNMSSHRLTHGERRHKCHHAGCTKSFTRHDQLKRHLRTTHKEDISLGTPMPDDFGLAFAEVA